MENYQPPFAGVLHMTLPNKPRSRNQCYYKE